MQSHVPPRRTIIGRTIPVSLAPCSLPAPLASLAQQVEAHRRVVNARTYLSDLGCRGDLTPEQRARLAEAESRSTGSLGAMEEALGKSHWRRPGFHNALAVAYRTMGDYVGADGEVWPCVCPRGSSRTTGAGQFHNESS